MSEISTYRFGRTFVKMASSVLLRPDIVHRGFIPSGPKVVVANHPSTTDPGLLLLTVSDPIHILISETLFQVPVLGPYLKAAGHITVLHDNGRLSLEQGVERLKAAQTVGIFPEGAISPFLGGFHRPRTGAARLALSAGVPVIPVGIYLDRERIRLIETEVQGKVEIGVWYLRGPYAMTVGEPLHFAGDLDDWNYVRDVSEQIMQRIAQLSYESAQRLARRRRLAIGIPPVFEPIREQPAHQDAYKEGPPQFAHIRVPQDLDMLDKDSLVAFLMQRSDALELLRAWRQIRDFEPLDLSGANLQGVQLNGVYLRGVCLDGADLSGAHLERANFFGCRLHRACFKDAWLNDASFERASLLGADLNGAHLARANLVMARLEEANVDGANLQGAILKWANLDAASLCEANLEKANLYKAKLDRAQLKRANLRQANLERTTLYYADLSHALMEEANLQVARLIGAKLVGTHLEEANLALAYLENVNLAGAYLDRANMQSARRLKHEQAAQAHSLWRTKMPDAQLYSGRYNLPGDLERAHAQGLDLTDALALANFYAVTIGVYRRGQQAERRRHGPVKADKA